MSYQLRTPNGTYVEGTLEHLRGKAALGPIEGVRPDGTFIFDYQGDTEVWWDEQRTITRNGQRVFVDESGEEFTEDQLELVEGEWIDDEFIENKEL